MTTTKTTTIMISSSFASETHRWMLASVDRRVDTFPAAILYSLNQRQRVDPRVPATGGSSCVGAVRGDGAEGEYIIDDSWQ
jgi:hypothetical protein